MTGPKHQVAYTAILKSAKSAVMFKTTVLMQGLLLNGPIYALYYNTCSYLIYLYTE